MGHLYGPWPSFQLLGCSLTFYLMSEARGNDQESYPKPEARGSSREEQPMSKELWLHGCRRAKRSYSMYKVRRGDHEEIPLVQGKEQRLHFAGAAMKRYHMSNLRESQVRW